MGYWEIVVPETVTNECTNPSVETDTTGWTVDGVNFSAIAQSSTYQRYGGYSAMCTVINGAATGAGNAYVNTPNVTVAGTALWTFSISYLIPAGNDGTYQCYVTGYASQTGYTTLTADGEWHRAEMSFTASGGGGVLYIRVFLASGAVVGNEYIYLDAVQYENLSYATTYCDGTQKGCEWNGTAHASTSTRSALSRAGGRVYDLTDDFGMYVTRHTDSGVAPVTQHYNAYSLIPGGEVTGYKVNARTLILSGYVRSQAGWSAFHTLMASLFDTFKPDGVPNNQPVLLRYTQASVTKEIGAIYEGGLEGNFDASLCPEQRFAIRFICPDPFWYEVGDSALILDTSDSATCYYAIGRLRSAGQWDSLGLAAPTGAGPVYAVLVASDGMVYIGGGFTGWNGVANDDYVAQYNPFTDTWSTWGAASDFNGQVNCLIEGPDGLIYAGGSFTNCHGVAAADHIAVWDGSAWAAVGTPLGAASVITTVWCFVFDSEGNLYIGGDFTDWASAAPSALDYVVMWDGTSYSAIGSGGTGEVFAVEVDVDDNLFIGGDFLNWAADADADYLAWWNGSAWAAVNDTAFNDRVLALEYDDSDGLLYIGGEFTDAASITTADFIVTWNRQAFAAVGSGLTSSLANPAIRDLHIAPDGILYAVGYRIETAGGITLQDSVMQWNGSSWANLDVKFPASTTVYALEIAHPDPVIASNYDVYFGFSPSGQTYYSGSATHTPDGTTQAYPIIYVNRSGGTSATLIQIRNETTGKILQFDYALLDEETLTIDLHQTQKSVSSSFFGPRPDALLKGCDFGTFALRPGANQITAFVYGPTATVTAYMVYRDTYWSID